MKIKTDFRWVARIVAISVVMSMVFTLVSADILKGAGYAVAFILLFIFIFFGIAFDILGVAVTAADETPFHSMASHRERGASEAIKLLRKSERVASICNDVVGDISGIVSGATAAVISANLVKDFSFSAVLTQLLVTAGVAGATIGGKAVGKTFAINNDTAIVLAAGRALSFFTSGKK